MSQASSRAVWGIKRIRVVVTGDEDVKIHPDGESDGPKQLRERTPPGVLDGWQVWTEVHDGAVYHVFRTPLLWGKKGED